MISFRISSAIDDRFGKTQFGFRKGWSGLSNISYILELAEQAHEMAEEALVGIFLDLEMCFDRIRSDELRSAMYRIGNRGNMLEVIILSFESW